MEKNTMKTTILVSTYNWHKALELSLSSMLRQTRMPDEIVIADDGSTNDTRTAIERIRKTSPIPIIHVWQEDDGFRKTIILNKAIAKATGDYILQVDGDVILSPHFVSDHLELAERNYFVCGSRVKLTPQLTKRILASHTLTVNVWNLPLTFILNSFRSRLLRRFLAEKYARQIDHLRGCNMAFWRDDLVKLHYAGVKKKALKMGGNVYHLYHKESSRSNEQRHLDELERVKREHISWCPNGLDKYLNTHS